MRNVSYSKLGIVNSVEKFDGMFKVPRYLKRLVSRDKDIPACFSERIREDFDLRGKLNSFEIP